MCFCHLLSHDLFDQLLQDRRLTFLRIFKIAPDTLLDVFTHHVDLQVHILPFLLPRCDHLFLGIGNKHNLEPALAIIHFGDGQAGPIQRHITLLDNIPQHRPVPRLQPKDETISIRRDTRDYRNGVDVSLHEMATHPRRRRHRPLEVDLGSFLQRAKIRPSQGLGRNADSEGGRVEFRDRETGAIDADAVAQGGVRQDLTAVADGERGAAAAAGCAGVDGGEIAHSWGGFD